MPRWLHGNKSSALILPPPAAIFDTLASVFNSDPGEKVRGVYQGRVDEINGLEEAMKALSDEQLRGKTEEFRGRLKGGESMESVLPDAFAVSVHDWNVLLCNV